MNSFDMAAVRGLQKYLQDNVPELNEVYDEWPYHGDEMNLPCCSIITAGTPEYNNLQPYTYSKIEDPDNELNDILTEVIAQIDGRIQIDVWTEYKNKRGEMLELITKALNKQNIEEDLPNGLSLLMTDYYNVIARFDQVGYTYMDSEENSQKSQWRVKIDILFSHVVVELKSRPRINEITISHQIADDNNVAEDDNNIDESYEII